MVAKYLYRKSDGVFIGGGFYDAQPPLVGDPPSPDYVNYGVAEFSDVDPPDPVRHRFDAVNGKRLMTQGELAALAETKILQEAELSSRQKDILTTVAFVLRQSNVQAWNAMTLEQKITAVRNGADTWRNLRIFAEKNL